MYFFEMQSLVSLNYRLQIKSREVFGLNTEKYVPEKTPYLDTFHTVMFVGC